MYGLLILAMCYLTSVGQSDTLQMRYDELMSGSETYEQYKVIVRSRLDGLWSEVQDSIAMYQDILMVEQAHSQKLQQEIQSLQEQADQMAARVKEMEDRQGTIAFLGMSLPAGLYHTLVWGLIILLIVGLIVVYGLSNQSRVTARQATSDLQHIQHELEQYKERTRVKEVKLKRELQTALNELEDLKRSTRK